MELGAGDQQQSCSRPNYLSCTPKCLSQMHLVVAHKQRCREQMFLNKEMKKEGGVVQTVKWQVWSSALLWLVVFCMGLKSRWYFACGLWLISIENLIIQLVHWHASEVLHHAHFYDVAHKRKRREAQVESFVVKNLGYWNVEEMGNANVEI